MVLVRNRNRMGGIVPDDYTGTRAIESDGNAPIMVVEEKFGLLFSSDE